MHYSRHLLETFAAIASDRLIKGNHFYELSISLKKTRKPNCQSSDASNNCCEVTNAVLHLSSCAHYFKKKQEHVNVPSYKTAMIFENRNAIS